MLDWSAWNKTNSLTQVGRLALYWYCETDMKWNIFMMYENWVWALIDCAVNRNQILYIHKTKCWDDNDKLLFAHYYLLYCLCWSIWWLWNLCGKRTQSERHGTWKKYKLMYEMIHVMQCPVCYIITYENHINVVFWWAHEEFQELSLGILCKIHLYYRNPMLQNRCGIARRENVSLVSLGLSCVVAYRIILESLYEPQILVVCNFCCCL